MQHYHKLTNQTKAESEPVTLLIKNFPKVPQGKTEKEYQKELKEELGVKEKIKNMPYL